MEATIYNPHDALFKKFFTDIEAASTFVKAYLDKELRQRGDFSTLKIESGSFIEEDLRSHHSDTLYSLKLDGVNG